MTLPHRQTKFTREKGSGRSNHSACSSRQSQNALTSRYSVLFLMSLGLLFHTLSIKPPVGEGRREHRLKNKSAAGRRSTRTNFSLCSQPVPSHLLSSLSFSSLDLCIAAWCEGGGEGESTDECCFPPGPKFQILLGTHVLAGGTKFISSFVPAWMPN